MPNPEEIVPNFISYSVNVLLVNELEGLGPQLAESLLALGCQVFYLGDSKKDSFDHLKGKTNFQLLEKVNQIQELNSLNYFFYLADHLADQRKKYLTDFLRISQEKKIRFLLLWDGDFSTSEQILRTMLERRIDGRICYFQEVYGPRILQGEVANLIKEIIAGKKNKLVMEKGLEISLVYFADLVRGLVWAMFSPETAEKVIDLSGEKISLVSLISEIQKKIDRVINVEFKEKVKDLAKEKLSEGKEEVSFPWEPEVTLSSGIEKTIAWFKEGGRNFSTENKIKKRKIFPSILVSRKKLILSLEIFCLLMIFFFVLPVAIFLGILDQAKKGTLAAQKAFTELNFPVAKKETQQAYQKIYFAQKMFVFASPYYEVFGFEDDLRQLELLISVWEKMLNDAQEALTLKEIFLPDFAAILKGEKSNLEADLPRMNDLLEKIYTDVSLVSVSIEKIDSENFLVKKSGLVKDLVPQEAYLTDLRKDLYRAKMILPLLPEIFGTKENKYYLLLLQNNFELRPTGGFLAGYGLLKFEKGSLVDVEIKNISAIDEKLIGQVEPPEKLKSYLGVTKWYLKDANWDPDFSASSEKIEWFFEKETGRVVDGVLAVDLNVAKRVLAEIGEVFLEDYKEKINQQNFLDRAVYFSQSGPFPGAEQKFDFFTLSSKTLFEEIKKQPETFFLKLLEIIRSALNEKDLLVNFHEPKIKELGRLFNWDGTIQPNLACQKISANCLPDFLFINEANLGANRVNYFLRRLINHQVTLDDSGAVKEQLKITYQNLSLSESWPGGQYKNYLRLYLPALANLESIMLNDASDPSYWVQIPPLKIDLYRERNWLVVGFLLEVPVKSQRTVEISYSLPKLVNLQREFSYTLLMMRQPGINETLYSFSLNFPISLKPLKVLPKGTVASNKVLVNDLLNQDKLVRVDFGH